MDVKQITVRLVRPSEERVYQELMEQHHYLGALSKISETLWYVACYQDQWVALLSYSTSALKCASRDAWIGWNMRYKYDRLKLIVNNSRFLIIPDWHRANLGVACFIPVFKAIECGLGRSVWAWDRLAGDLCGCNAFFRNRL